MQILVRDKLVIDYCDKGYVQMDCTVVCPSKNKTFENCVIVTVNSIPSDIDTVMYSYVNGEFIRATAKNENPLPLIVTFNVSEQAASHTFEEVQEAIKSGRIVLARIDKGPSSIYYTPYISYDSTSAIDIIQFSRCFKSSNIGGSTSVEVVTYRSDGYIESELASAAPEYSYGAHDLVAGESPLETGKLYFMYK